MAHPLGPLQLADFIGLDVCLSILNVMYDGFANEKYKPCQLLVTMVANGKLGVKSGEGFYDYSQNKKAEVIAKQFV
jgi:3-hydroxybutyryl-CoA dehydrogenase